MKPLSEYLNEELIRKLKLEISKGKFPSIDFETAMKFILSDGLIPKSGLNAQSFMMLEDWMRAQEEEKVITYTTTELKNKTGEILDQVLQGKTVRLIKHGRVVAEMRGV